MPRKLLFFLDIWKNIEKLNKSISVSKKYEFCFLKIYMKRLDLNIFLKEIKKNA